MRKVIQLSNDSGVTAPAAFKPHQVQWDLCPLMYQVMQQRLCKSRDSAPRCSLVPGERFQDLTFHE